MLVASVVLLAGLGLTLFATYYASHSLELRAQARFDSAVEQTRSMIQTRMEAYTAILRGGAGLFAIEPQLSRAEFRTYVDRLQLPMNYPGIQGIGFSLRLVPSETNALIAFMRQQRITNFHVWPQDVRSEYHSIIYLEPSDKRNTAAIGYDMFTEATRREAMERARDEGIPVASGKVTLVQEIEEPKQPGFLIYVPVYDEDDVPPTIEERRAKLHGFVYSPFRADDLFRGIFHDRSPLPGLEFEIFDSVGTNAGNLLHRSFGLVASNGTAFRPTYETTLPLAIPGHRWTIHFAARPEFEVNWYVIPLLLGGGTLISLILFYLAYYEARARRQAEETAMQLKTYDEALRESEEWLRLMIESSQDFAIFSIDSQGRVASWNTGAERLFGYTTDEIMGENADLIFTPEDRVTGQSEMELQEAEQSGAAKDERWHMRKDGSLLFISGVVRPMLDETGKKIGFIKVARDITEQRQARENLLREKQLSDAIINSLPGIFFVANRHGKFLRWNQMFEEVTGRSATEIARMQPEDFFEHAERLLLEPEAGRVRSAGTTTVEARLRTKDGRRVEYLLTGRWIGIEGGPCLLGIGLDISDRKAAEQALRDAREQLQRYATKLEERVAERTAKLQQSLQSLEGVLYHVAHDLRAPLRAQAGFTNILLEEYASELDAQGQNYVARISEAARRMDELVRDLLAYGRLAHMAMPAAKVDLEAAVNGALEHFADEIKKRGAAVDVKYPLPPVRANAAVLGDVVSNLLSNALKFVPEETPPHIRIWADNGACVRLWIEDNGIGIKPQYHDRIFRVFERLQPPERYPGTGIGLAIVRKGIERMGGRVGVESEVGQGSRFWLELPAVHGERKERARSED
jgi:PAS domain S-box-containing protein